MHTTRSGVYFVEVLLRHFLVGARNIPQGSSYLNSSSLVCGTLWKLWILLGSHLAHRHRKCRYSTYSLNPRFGSCLKSMLLSGPPTYEQTVSHLAAMPPWLWWTSPSNSWSKSICSHLCVSCYLVMAWKGTTLSFMFTCGKRCFSANECSHLKECRDYHDNQKANKKGLG